MTKVTVKGQLLCLYTCYVGGYSSYSSLDWRGGEGEGSSSQLPLKVSGTNMPCRYVVQWLFWTFVLSTKSLPASMQQFACRVRTSFLFQITAIQ